MSVSLDLLAVHLTRGKLHPATKLHILKKYFIVDGEGAQVYLAALGLSGIPFGHLPAGRLPQAGVLLPRPATRALILVVLVPGVQWREPGIRRRLWSSVEAVGVVGGLESGFSVQGTPLTIHSPPAQNTAR